jgi:hypothetical protein
VFHCVPLHSAPAGRRYGRVATPMRHTDTLSERLLLIPLWIGVDRDLVLRSFIEAGSAVCGAARGPHPQARQCSAIQAAGLA